MSHAKLTDDIFNKINVNIDNYHQQGTVTTGKSQTI